MNERLAITNSATGSKLLEALGLPKGTTSVEISFEPHDIVRITSTLNASKDHLRALSGALVAMAGDSDPSIVVLPEPPPDIDGVGRWKTF